MQAVKIRDLEPGGPTGQFRVELLHGDLARRPTTPTRDSEYGEQRLSVEIVMWRSESPTGYIPGIDQLGAT